MAAHQSVLAPDHARILRAMRAERALAEDPETALVEERDLTVYDRIAGVG